MKDVILRSDSMTVHANAFGAELKGVEVNGVEYLWQGDVDTYARTSPTLFPIIGRFLSDTYYVGSKDYKMPLNGFAMDSNFSIETQSPSSVTFVLTDSEKTRAQYPFSFRLRVTYKAEGKTLTVHHQVENTGSVPLPFCVGCHTAYKWPLTEEEQPEDAFLRFEKEENLLSFNPFGLELPFLDHTDVRPLDHSLFANYTRSLRNIQSQWVELASRKHGHAVRIWREQYPYLAIWSLPTPDAALICLEPCTSVHPGNHPSLHLEDRDGAMLLPPGEICDREFRVEFR